MHEITPSLSAQVRRTDSTTGKIASLADRYQGQTCVVVTCGPSLASVPGDRLRAGLQGVTTIAVKQAIDIVGEQADFHCWNAFNVGRFRWPSSDTLRCFVAGPTGRIPQWNEHDLEFEQINGEGSLANSLAYRRDFGDYILAKDPLRPFGPGIMYELVFYLAVHLGVSRIITVGWDIANRAGKNTHFYDTRNDQSFFERGRADATSAPAQRARGRLPEPIRYGARLLKTRLAHSRDELYNRTAALIGEPELVAESTVAAVEWLRSAGVSLAAVTDSEHLGGHIERLSLEQALDELANLRGC